MSFDSGEEILIIKEVHQNGFHIYFGGFKHLIYYNLIECYFLDPALVIWYVILVIFSNIQWYFSKLKKVNLVC